MRTYTVTEYDRQDYDDFENNITIDQVIAILDDIDNDWIGDYDYTGEERDFQLFQLHVALREAIKLLAEIKVGDKE